MKTEHLRFPGPTGGELAARIEAPDGEPAAYALFAHCFTCSKDLRAARRIGHALAGRGIAMLALDFTGIGESPGDFAASNFSSNVDDLLAAADFLRRTRRAPALLVGHSLGGAAVLAAAARIPEAVAVATIGAPSSTELLRETLLKIAPGLAGEGEAEVDLGGAHRFRLRRQLLDDLSHDPLHAAVAGLGKALLILHSPVDLIVGIDHARRLFDAARHPKSFVSLAEADHLLSDERDARYVGDLLAVWAERYLEAGETGEGAAVASEPVEDAPPGEVRVRGGRSLVQEIEMGRYRLIADEPLAVGGTERGPTPYDLLLAALGACTSMTLRIYADAKKMALDSIGVRMRHAKVHAADCAQCTTKEGKLDRIEREIELGGDLSEAQRARLLEIADRCPVHRTLTSEIEIRTRLTDREPRPAAPTE